jgi:hypothetical protein
MINHFIRTYSFSCSKLLFKRGKNRNNFDLFVTCLFYMDLLLLALYGDLFDIAEKSRTQLALIANRWRDTFLLLLSELCRDQVRGFNSRRYLGTHD